MKIRKVIGILVCLGMVAFASSTASAFSLIEDLEHSRVFACDNGRNTKAIPGPAGYYSLLGDLTGDTNGDIHVMIIDAVNGVAAADVMLDSLDHDLYRAATISGDNLAVLGIHRDLTLPAPAYEPVIWTVSSTGEVLSEIKFYVDGLTYGLAADLAAVGGNYYVVGNGINATTGDSDVFFSGCQPDGICVTITLEKPGFHEYALQIDATNDGSFIITSRSTDPAKNFNITKVDPDGGVIWSRVIDSLPLYTDQYVGTHYDKLNDKIYSATQYISPDTGKGVLHLLKLNADGTTDTEADIGGDLDNDTRIDMMDFATMEENWLFGGVETTPEWVAQGVVLTVNPALELESITRDDVRSFFSGLDAPDDPEQSAAFGDELAFVVSGSYSQTGVKLFCNTDGSCQKMDNVQPSDYDTKIVSPDGLTVFIAIDPETYGSLITAFRPELGPGPGPKKKPFPPGQNILVEFIDEFVNYVSVLLGDTFEEGYISVEEDPEGTGEMINIAAVGLPYDIIIEGGHDPDTVWISIGYDEIPQEDALYFFKWDPDSAEWVAYGESVDRDTLNNKVTVKLEHECVFSLGYIVDAVIATEDLISDVYELNIKAGILNSLDAKLQNIRDALTAANAGLREDAINKFQAFINAVEAQSGKELTEAEAAGLIAKAKAIMAVL